MSNQTRSIPAGVVEWAQSADCPDYVRTEEVERARHIGNRPLFDNAMAERIALAMLREMKY